MWHARASKPIIALLLALVVFPFSSTDAPDDPAHPSGPESWTSMPNPAAVYCLQLGYDYAVVTAPDGRQHGTCALPGGAICDAWDFLNGTCGQDHSICALRGLNTVVVRDGEDRFSREYAVCVDPDGSLRETVTDLLALPESLKGWDGPGSDRLGPPADQPPPGSDGAPQEGSVPTAFDWRDHAGSDWTTPVRDQGQCGSCWAFAAVGVAESIIRIGHNDPDLNLDLSEQYLVTDCALSVGACDGGYTGEALRFIRDSGIPDEDCLPYHDGDRPRGCTFDTWGCDTSLCTYYTGDECSDYRCTDRCGDWQSRLAYVDGVTYMGSNPSRATMQQALVDHGPLAVSLNMDGSFDQNDVYRCPSNDYVSHGVVAVGYDDAEGYWIAKNSWGATWGPGSDGYFKVAYGNCAIEKNPYYAEFNGTTATVAVEPAQQSVRVGDTFDVSVTVADVADLGGFEFELHYDPSVVHVEDIQLGPFPGSTGRTWSPLGPDIDNGSGVARFGGFSFGTEPGESGSGEMAHVTLSAPIDCQAHPAGDSTDLDLQGVLVVNTAGSGIPAGVQDGQVHVICCPWPPDFDADGDVDVADIMHAASKWGSQRGDPDWDTCVDVDDDGDVDVADIMQIAAQWGWRDGDPFAPRP